MNKKNRRSCLTLTAAGLLGSLCLLALAAGLLLFLIPGQAARLFGPPRSGLGLTQQIYLSTRLLMESNALTLPANPYGQEQAFRIEMGESPGQVALRLEEQGLVANARAFRDYLVYSGLDTTLQAGEYRLSPRLSSIELADELQDATPAEVDFVILPGWRMEEIAASLPTSGLNISPELFLQTAASPPESSRLSLDLPEGTTLEGFLLPDTYLLGRDIQAADLVALFTGNFETQMDEELLEGFEQEGLSLYEAVTLASIVEREAISEQEMPQIASVFYNRLNAGIKLDSDPTVQYALGFNTTQATWWTNPLSAADLRVDSPYNTYLYPGLPPGPIANPSLEALRAVAFPASTPFYYFRARCDDPTQHDFSETYQEHLAKSCQ